MNYDQIDIDFIQRTLEIIDQYEDIRKHFPSEKQYNHTLFINCMVGLIILPKEKTYSRIPTEKIHLQKILDERGIRKSRFNEGIRDTQQLFRRLRNAIAHFGIEVMSETGENKIDRIIFYDRNMFVADFHSDEIVPFLRYYAEMIIDNHKRYPGK